MRLFLSLAGAIWCGLILAQELRFQHLTTDDGLSDNAITCLYEDRAGYLWIGTENGLDNYDGNSMRKVDGAQENIAAIIQDRQGVIWIATKDHGLLRMPPGENGVKALRHMENDPHSIASDQLTALYDLDDTTLLIGSRQTSLIFCDKRSLAFSYWTDSLSLTPARASVRLPENNGWCHAIVPLDEEHLWIGMLNFHITFIADRRSGRIEHIALIQRPGSETQTNALLMNGLLYNGGWQNGIDVIPMGELPVGQQLVTLAPRMIDMPDETLSMVAWNGGRILAGTRQSGLFLVDPVTGRKTQCSHSRHDANSLVSDRVRCMLVDHGGTLWVGTANGLSRHVPGVWTASVRELFPDDEDPNPDLFVHRVEQLPDGRVRIYTSEGFFITDSTRAHVQHEAVTWKGMALQPTVMGRDHTGAQLLGTEYGIVRYEGSGRVSGLHFPPNDGVGHIYQPGTMYQVRGLWPDSIAGRPVLVIGSLGFGVNVVDAHTGLIIGNGAPASSTSVNTRALVNSMLRTTDGTYWIASADGFFHWSAREPMLSPALRTSGPVSNDGILAVGEDVRQLLLTGDTLWAVTHAGSLYSEVNGSLHRYIPPAWMPHALLGLAADRKGLLWITTDDGLLRFDPRDTSFLHVPVNDGRDFRKLGRAITTLADGRIAFCANNALVTFDPRVYDALAPMTDAYITSISAAGRPLSARDGVVRLSYRASLVDIGISALSHGYPRPMTFEYRLDGVETEWRSISAHDAIRYAGVPIGTHTLLARMRDPFGRVSTARAILIIAVSGPIWQQWWFYALALLLISIALYALYNYRLKHAMKLQRVRDRIASDLHDEVGSSLSSITIGSQLAAQLSPQASDQVKKLLARIGETSSQSLRGISDIVWAIDPKNDEGEALVKRMRRIAHELLESKGIQVTFSVGAGVEELRLPMTARKEIVLIYKEAAHNASKYSGARSVLVSLHCHNGLLAMSVKDDGRGFDPTLHPDGHGLGSMSRRAEALGESLELKSAPGAGTLVAVRVDLTRIRD